MNPEFQKRRREFYRELGLNIARQRKEAGLTQEKLAERIDISKDYLGHIEAENCEVYPSLEILLRISGALDVPLELLFPLSFPFPPYFDKTT